MKNQTIVYITGFFAVVVIIAVLHTYGFRIYGYPYMYRCPPPKDEGWIRVTGFPEPDQAALENGERVSLYPFYFTEYAFTLSPDELSRLIFDVPLSDLYLRRNNDREGEKWIARVGNKYLCAFRSFFPSREYGYYEDEFLSALTIRDAYRSNRNRLVGFVSEEALKEYYEIEEEPAETRGL